MFSRPHIAGFAGLVLVPLAAFYIPWVSPYWTVPIGAGLAIVMVRLKPGAPITELGLAPPRKLGQAVLLGAMVGIVLVLSSRLLLGPVIDHVTATHRDLSRFDNLRGNWRSLLPLLPTVWISAGIGEEIVYRGYLISQTAELLGNSRPARFAAVLLAAILFSLAHEHQGPSGMLLTGTLGLLFGLLVLQQRGNLWANMVAHIVGDTASLVAITLNWDLWLDHLGRHLLFAG